jgi:hypothetical protein
MRRKNRDTHISSGKYATQMLINHLKKFSKLPTKEKVFFMEAYLTLGIMRGAVLTIPFKRLTKSLRQSTNNKHAQLVGDTQMETAVTIGRVIMKAAVHTPWESTCLAQSLTVQRMLINRGIPGVFYLGVAKDETAGEKMKAHSWSQCGETIITGEIGHEDFTVLSAYKWEKQ